MNVVIEYDKSQILSRPILEYIHMYVVLRVRQSKTEHERNRAQNERVEMNKNWAKEKKTAV